MNFLSFAVNRLGKIVCRKDRVGWGLCELGALAGDKSGFGEKFSRAKHVLSLSAESILSGVEGLRINFVDRGARKNETSDCSALPFLARLTTVAEVD